MENPLFLDHFLRKLMVFHRFFCTLEDLHPAQARSRNQEMVAKHMRINGRSRTFGVNNASSKNISSLFGRS
jgi:hypothetical protein